MPPIRLETARWREPLNDSTGARQSDWSRVVRLEPGLTIVVEAAGAPPVSRRFVHADDSSLLVIDLDHVQLPSEARRMLLEAVSSHPVNFRRLAEGFRFISGTVRLTPDLIFVDDQAVVAAAEIVQAIARADVTAILTPPYRRGSIAGAIGGAVAGGVVGYHAARRLVFSRRRDAFVWMVLALVGLPLVGALIGSQMQRGVTQRVIYRAP